MSILTHRATNWRRRKLLRAVMRYPLSPVTGCVRILYWSSTAYSETKATKKKGKRK